MNFGYENKTPEGYRYREDAAKQNSFSAYEQQRTPEYQRSQPQKAAKPDTT